MRRTISTIVALAVLAALLLASRSDAAVTTTGAGAIGHGSFVPPSCSNSLDFTKACNSQYIGAIL